jgi:hypothetical protein
MPLFGRKAKAPHSYDPTYGDADAAALLAALAAEDWPAAKALLTDRTHHDLGFLVRVGGKAPAIERWLPAVLRTNPADRTAQLLYGSRMVAWAWEARSDAMPQYVSRDQFEVFFQRLRVAEECLQDLVRHEPGNATAWAESVTVARGLQLLNDESWRRFTAAVEIDPTNDNAHWQMLQTLCRKWFGSHEQMFTFAEDSAKAAPEGTLPGALPVEAHIEQWLDLGEDSPGYFDRPEVKAALHAAADRSVNHPRYRAGKGWPRVHNAFAMTFGVAREFEAAAKQFRIIGEQATDRPWHFLAGEPYERFLDYRKRAYKAAPTP